jgi:hypothetical protein
VGVGGWQGISQQASNKSLILMKFKIENACYVAKGMSLTNQNFAVFEGV